MTGGGSLTLDEMVEQFVEAFKIEVKATPNLIYKEGENYDSMVELASRMLDAVSANWSDCYTVKAVARAFKVEVPGLDCSLIGEWDCVVQDGRDICIVDWKTSASRWPAGKAERDLQATVFSYAYEKLTGTAPLFDFRRFEALASRAQYAVNKGVFLPNETSFACGECPYWHRCRQWHLKKWR